MGKIILIHVGPSCLELLSKLWHVLMLPLRGCQALLRGPFPGSGGRPGEGPRAGPGPGLPPWEVSRAQGYVRTQGGEKDSFPGNAGPGTTNPPWAS